jgi:hypothetical protein
MTASFTDTSVKNARKPSKAEGSEKKSEELGQKIKKKKNHARLTKKVPGILPAFAVSAHL